MLKWIETNALALIMVVFIGGGAYVQIVSNYSALKEQTALSNTLSRQVAVMQEQVSAHQRTLDTLSLGADAQYKEFLNKLEDVITRLDKRDESQNTLISKMMVEVGILKEKSR